MNLIYAFVAGGLVGFGSAWAFRGWVARARAKALGILAEFGRKL